MLVLQLYTAKSQYWLHKYRYTTIYMSSNLNIFINYSVYCKYKFRVFSTLSAPVNGGVPKANGPIPNKMKLTFFPIENTKHAKDIGLNVLVIIESESVFICQKSD